MEVNRTNANLIGKNFFKICEDLNIAPKDQAVILGQRSLRTVSRWKKDRTIGLSLDTFNRVAIFFGIVMKLYNIYPGNKEIIGNWFHRKRVLFKGKSALELITEVPLQSQTALFSIRKILDMYLAGEILELL